MEVEIQNSAHLFPPHLVPNKEQLLTTTTENRLGLISSMASGAVVAESGLTFNGPISSACSPSSKRQRRDLFDHQRSSLLASSFYRENMSSSIQQQQQLEIDHLVTQHTMSLRVSLWEWHRRLMRRLAAAAEEEVLRRVRAKEAELEEATRINAALEERVRGLCVEGQVWRDLACANEAAAAALRSNLERHQQQQQQSISHGGGNDNVVAAAAESAESSCFNNAGGRRRGMCRRCGEEEAAEVMVLPCRHLCLCSGCGPVANACPVCGCTKHGSVHVKFS